MPISKLPKKKETTSSLVNIKDIPSELVKYVIHTLKDPNFFKNNSLTKQQVDLLFQSMKRASMGIQAGIIQTCNSDCESHSKCPLVILNRAPYENLCPIETEIFEKRFLSYKSAVKTRLKALRGDEDAGDVDEDQILLTIIGELVEADIIEMRANALIAEEGLVEQVPVLASNEGPEYRMDETVALKIKERMKNRRERNFRALLATPEMIAKSKMKEIEGSVEGRVLDARAKARSLMLHNSEMVTFSLVEADNDNKSK